MRLRFVPWVALFLLAASPSVARPAEDTAKPALIVRFKSLDGLLADARYLVELAGREEQAKQAEAMIKSLTGDKGLDGIDTKKPFGLYGKVGAKGTDSQVVVLIPVADEKAFLALLERLNIKPEKGKDGLYTVTSELAPVPAFFRFANGYIYATVANQEALEPKALLAPAAVLPVQQAGTLSLTLDLAQVPAELKRTVIGQTELRLANLKDEKVPGETAAQKDFRVAVIDEAASRLKSLLNEGGDVNLSLDLDRKATDLSLSLSLTGKPGSALAADISSLAQTRSVAAGLLGSDAAVDGFLHVSLPEKLRQALQPVLDEGVKTILTQAKDAGERDAMESVLKAALPTAKAGELDAGFNLRGPNAKGIYTLVLGLKVKDGNTIEKALKDLVPKAPPDVRKTIKLDVAKADSVAIHRIDPDKVDENTRQMLGDNPIFVAARGDALLAAAGADGLAALKEAVTAEPKAGRVAQVEVSLGRLATLMGRQQKAIPEAARKAFAKDQGGDRILFSLEGGKALTLRLSVKPAVVTFFSLVEKAQKGQ
jgi:hypothetical protein